MDSVTKFLVYCVEIFKTAHKQNRRQVVEIFSQYGVFDYIVQFYGALHTTGPEYIVEDIDGLIEERHPFNVYYGAFIPVIYFKL